MLSMRALQVRTSECNSSSSSSERTSEALAAAYPAGFDVKPMTAATGCGVVSLVEEEMDAMVATGCFFFATSNVDNGLGHRLVPGTLGEITFVVIFHVENVQFATF